MEHGIHHHRKWAERKPQDTSCQIHTHRAEQSCTLQVCPGLLNTQNKSAKSYNSMCLQWCGRNRCSWTHDSPSKTLIYILIHLLAFGYSVRLFAMWRSTRGTCNPKNSKYEIRQAQSGEFKHGKIKLLAHKHLRSLQQSCGLTPVFQLCLLLQSITCFVFLFLSAPSFPEGREISQLTGSFCQGR